jgi:hypothetical protein
MGCGSVSDEAFSDESQGSLVNTARGAQITIASLTEPAPLVGEREPSEYIGGVGRQYRLPPTPVSPFKNFVKVRHTLLRQRDSDRLLIRPSLNEFLTDSSLHVCHSESGYAVRHIGKPLWVLANVETRWIFLSRCHVPFRHSPSKAALLLLRFEPRRWALHRMGRLSAGRTFGRSALEGDLRTVKLC